MPDKLCQTCGGRTNTAVCDYLEYTDLEPRACYLRWEGERWVRGCGYESLRWDGLTRRFADHILQEQKEQANE